jgi:hypothetical protein
MHSLPYLNLLSPFANQLQLLGPCLYEIFFSPDKINLTVLLTYKSGVGMVKVSRLSQNQN